MAPAAAAAKELLKIGYQMRSFALIAWWASCAEVTKSWAFDVVAILVSTKVVAAMKSAFDLPPEAVADTTVRVCQLTR